MGSTDLGTTYLVRVISVISSLVGSIYHQYGDIATDGVGEYSNPVFTLRAFDPEDGRPNFEFPALGLKAYWYYHIGRGFYVESDYTSGDCYKILTECLGYMHWQVARERD